MATHGRYTIVRKIADGGMAEIFLAVQRGAEGFEKPVVLKRILTAFYADPQFRNMFIDEAHISMSLNHSNIVQILDLGVADGRYFLVLELVDGWDLEQVLQRAATTGTIWPTGLGVFVTAEVCRALAYAHGKEQGGKPLGIVHRDVSPNNVFISSEGEVKLADFGIAKAMGKREQTAAGVIKGKVAFMSPEQAHGQNVDPRSDLFSLGTVLYLMATGRRPFDAATDLESMLRVQRAEFQPPELANPQLNRDLAAIISRSMRLEPKDRYQTADEMLADLERVLRESFLSVGRSELKRWLADLQLKDGAAPLGGASGMAFESDMAEGYNVVLEDSSREISLPDVAALAFAPREPSRQIDAAAATKLERIPTADVQAVTAEPPPQLRKGTGWHSFLLGTIFALLAVGVVTTWGIPWGRKQLQKWGFTSAAVPPHTETTSGRPVRGERPSRGAEKVARTAENEAKAEAKAKEEAKEKEEAKAKEEAKPIATETPDAQATPPVAVAPTAEEAEDDEESLLKRAVKDIEQMVIGEEEGEGDAAKASRTTKTTATARSTKVSPVVVKLASAPKGAIVRIGSRVFGRTPIALHFKPGAMYRVTFVKKGYATASKNVAVSNKKGQLVSVKLAVVKKKPVKKRRTLITGR